MKLNNPYLQFEGFNCYGCAPHNPMGLKMEFELNDDVVISSWMPETVHQGFHQIVHGGVLASLADEIAGWAIQVFCKTSGFTSEMNIQYLKPAYVQNGPLQLEAVVSERQDKRALVDVKVLDKDAVVCTTAQVTYYLFSTEVARDKFHYPGAAAFFKQQ